MFSPVTRLGREKVGHIAHEAEAIADGGGGHGRVAEAWNVAGNKRPGIFPLLNQKALIAWMSQKRASRRIMEGI
jgi:hypothetical protein